jgi:signal recognition particle GTPase
MQDLVQKIIKAKRAGGMAQVVECLPCKHKALSSNSNTTKKEREEGRKEGKRM